MTTATLNGEREGLNVEEASEGQSKLLEAFSAWVMEEEAEELAEDDFLFTHVRSLFLYINYYIQSLNGWYIMACYDML